MHRALAAPTCGKTTQVPVPWVRPGSHFTLMFEVLALILKREMPVVVCARMLSCSQNALWRVLDAYTAQVRALESHVQVRKLVVDDTVSRDGHDYIMLVLDLSERRRFFATPGRGARTLAAEQLPNAAIASDRFRVI